jgi:purine-binding chemotaxis protein CheW
MNDMQALRAGSESENRASSPAGRPTPLEIILGGRRAAGCAEEPGQTGEKTRSVATEQLEFLSVRISGENYGIDIMAIREVIKPRRVTEIPWTTSPVRGVISLRGAMVPVLAMAERLGVEPLPSGGRERVVVVRSSFGPVGLQVDQVGQVGRVPQSGIHPVSPVPEGDAGQGFAVGMAYPDGRGITLLDVERLADLRGCVLNRDREWTT